MRSKEKYEELLERVRILEMETVEKMDEQADQIVQMTQEIKQLRKELKEKEETTEEGGGLEENRRRLEESKRELESKSRGTGEKSGRIGERGRETAEMLKEIERREQGNIGTERQEQETGGRKQKISRINDYVEQQIQKIEREIGRLAELKNRKAVENQEKESVSDTKRETSDDKSTLVPQVLLEKIAEVRELFLKERIKVAQKDEEIKAHEKETEIFWKEATKDRDDFKKDLEQAKRMNRQNRPFGKVY